MVSRSLAVAFDASMLEFVPCARGRKRGGRLVPLRRLASRTRVEECDITVAVADDELERSLEYCRVFVTLEDCPRRHEDTIVLAEFASTTTVRHLDCRLTDD